MDGCGARGSPLRRAAGERRRAAPRRRTGERCNHRAAGRGGPRALARRGAFPARTFLPRGQAVRAGHRSPQTRGDACAATRSRPFQTDPVLHGHRGFRGPRRNAPVHCRADREGATRHSRGHYAVVCPSHGHVGRRPARGGRGDRRQVVRGRASASAPTAGTRRHARTAPYRLHRSGFPRSSDHASVRRPVPAARPNAFSGQRVRRVPDGRQRRGGAVSQGRGCVPGSFGPLRRRCRALRPCGECRYPR